MALLAVLAIVIAVFSPGWENADAQVAKLTPDSGMIRYEGYGPANAKVNLSVATSFDTSTYGNSITFHGVYVAEDGYFRITISPVDSITVSSPGIPFVSKTYEATGSTVCLEVGRIEILGVPITGNYDVTTTVQPHGSSTVNVELVAMYKTDGSGKYTVSLNTAGLPSGVYSIKRDGTEVARAYLGFSTCDLNLAQGWNLISLPIVPVDSQVTGIFTQDQLNNIDVIWDYNGGDWKFFSTNPSYADDPRRVTSMAMDVRKGYYVYCNQPMTVRLVGQGGSDAVALSDLPGGSWNLVGFPSTTTQDVSSLYSGADVVYELDNGWHWYTNNYDQCQQPLSSLHPGYGYWVLTK
jgi:hypothetical protein